MVPLLVSWPRSIPQGKVDADHLVSQIDIVPTLCDYAGIETTGIFTGESLRPIMEQQEAAWRNFLVVELADYKPDRSRKGRMLRTKQYKYCVYTQGAANEQLFDLKNDPGENQNLAFDPAFKSVKETHRQYLETWMEQTDDTARYSIPYR